MAFAPSPSHLSLNEFLKQPETQPASEYINGKIYQKPMPKGKHSRLQTQFSTQINQIGEPNRLACAFTELRCTFGGRSLVPDISVFTWSRIPLDNKGEIENIVELAPDWVIEILSPDQSPIRVINTILFCLNHGTELGWLVDDTDRSIMVLRPDQQPEVCQDQDPVPVLSGLAEWPLSVAEVFSSLSFS